MSDEQGANFERRKLLNIDRRHFLKTTGLSMGVAGFAGKASASESSPTYLTKVQFVEFYREHEGINEATLHSDSAGSSYFLFDNFLSLGLAATPHHIDKLKSNSLIASDRRKYYKSSQNVGFSENQMLKTSGNYSQSKKLYATLENNYQFPSVELHDAQDDSLIIDFDDEKFRIDSQTERHLRAHPRSVRPTRDGEEISVTPKLSVKHHGGIDVHGKKNAITLPKETMRRKVRRLSAQLRRTTREREGYSLEETEDFYIFNINR